MHCRGSAGCDANAYGTEVSLAEPQAGTGGMLEENRWLLINSRHRLATVASKQPAGANPLWADPRCPAVDVQWRS